MRPWLRNAITFGAISAVVTLLLNWLGTVTASGSGCLRSSPLGILGFLVFLVLMAAAGFMTTRAGDTVGMASIAGLVGAAISAVGTIIGLVIVVGSINANCINNTSNISSSTLLSAAGVATGVIVSLVGLGVGAGMGAIGGAIGRRPTTTAA